MALPQGARLGHFEIVSLLGVGGMGEVYRARDTRLDRSVALKVLSTRISANPSMKQRFDREARSISRLSHPNICALYDVGHQEETDFLVMEYLEGETLASRLAKGPLPIKDVLRYSLEIAEALDTAHRQNIVHRDLKPSNIMLMKTGAKLLDFGLAKLQEQDSEGSIEWLSATKSRELTAEGTIIGTVQYMSPEQLEGNAIDARTDIFSLGTVIYEMATGRKAFTGKTVPSLITAILKSEPDPMSAVQPLSPESLDRVVQVCLEKNPADRWQTAHDLAVQLRWITEGTTSSAAARKMKRTKRRALVPWMLTALLFLFVLILAIGNYRLIQKPPQQKEEVKKLSVLVPENTTIEWLAVSPDGRQIAFVVSGPERGSSLWLRSLDSLQSTQMPDTDDASCPFWSPDSKFIAFFAEDKLKKIAVAGGSPTTLCDAAKGHGGSWNQSGVILFSAGAIYRVNSGGGERLPVTILDGDNLEDAHRWPCFLPDGRHFIYYIRGEKSGTYLSSLDSKQKERILSILSRAEYAASGYLLYIQPTGTNDGNLMAVKFDTDHFKVTGEPVTLAEKVAQRNEVGPGGASFSVSTSDALIYATPPPFYGQWLWFDRKGKPLSLKGLPDGFGLPVFSPDGKKLAITNGAVYIQDLITGASSRFSFEQYAEYPFGWSPDGQTFGYIADAKSGTTICIKRSDGAGKPEVLFFKPYPGLIFLGNWSADGRYISFTYRDPKTNLNVWVLPLFGDRKPIQVTKDGGFDGQFSPDGKYIAYESGDIYVRAFPPEAGGIWQITNDGGDYPMWRSDGKELFFETGNKIMEVPVETEPTFHAGTPAILFERHPPSGTLWNADHPYAVTPDGQRFLVNTAKEQMPQSSISVILNWQSLLTSN